MRSGLIEEQQDAADDVFGGGGCGADFDEVDGEDEIEGPQDQLILLKLKIAEQNARAVTDRVKRGAVNAVGRQRVVVAVEYGAGVGEDEGVHVERLAGRDADGDEALPGAAGAGSACAGAEQDRCGQMKHGLHSRRADIGLAES